MNNNYFLAGCILLGIAYGIGPKLVNRYMQSGSNAVGNLLPVLCLLVGIAVCFIRAFRKSEKKN